MILVVCVVLFSSLVSAEIIINQEPKNLYNLGDTINLPIKIATLIDISSPLELNLICNGIETEVYKEYIVLSAGEEVERNPAIPLVMSFIGRSSGTCKIKLILGGEEPLLTNEFTISNYINVNVKSEKTEFSPEGSIEIEGDAIKENGDLVNGVVEIEMVGQEVIEIMDTVKNGYFYIDFLIPPETAAGQYSLNINVYEKDANGEVTSQGFADYSISITQISTSLEIAFENQEVEPGTDLKVKAILHDQTGEKIKSNAILTIKNDKGKILEEVEKSTDEFLEFPIKYNELSSEWTVAAVSGELTTETTFKIIEKEDVRIELINKTIILTNIGNVPYDNNVLIKIGEESININASLGIDKTQKYSLSAPDGEYEVEVTIDGESRFSGMAILTGKRIDVKESSRGLVSLVKYPFVWIFIIAVLGFVTFIIFKKGYKKNFIGYINSKRKKKDKEVVISKKKLMINIKNKAELSLSIKGDKQNISLVCLKIKNLEDIKSEKGNAKETLQKIIDIAEENKAFIYQNHNELFFLLSPLKTKTFNNETAAIKIAQEIKEILTEHNKLFKQKIDFGISLNYGTIVAKSEKDSLKFMSMGTLITTAKKISSLSKGEVYLGEKMNLKLRPNIKTEKQDVGKVPVYTIKEIRDKEKHRKFIGEFMKRMEKK